MKFSKNIFKYSNGHLHVKASHRKPDYSHSSLKSSLKMCLVNVKKLMEIYGSSKILKETFEEMSTYKASRNSYNKGFVDK